MSSVPSRLRAAFATVALAAVTVLPRFAQAAEPANNNSPAQGAAVAAPAPAAAPAPVQAATPEKRVVYLRGRIDDDKANTVNDALTALDDKAPGVPIELRINSGGGDVDAGLNIFDTIKSLRSPVATVCESQCASMAALLFIAGTPGMRSMRPHAEVLLHELSAGSEGTYSRMKSDMVSIERREVQLMQILADYTGHSKAEMDALVMGRNVTFGAEEAVNAGLADKIQQPLQKAAAPKYRAPEPPLRRVPGTIDRYMR